MYVTISCGKLLAILVKIQHGTDVKMILASVPDHEWVSYPDSYHPAGLQVTNPGMRSVCVDLSPPFLLTKVSFILGQPLTTGSNSNP